jgi:hypothetical protein
VESVVDNHLREEDPRQVNAAPQQVYRRGLEKPRHILAHLMLPIGPVVPALGTPVVQGMSDSLAGEDLGQPIGGAAVLPLTCAGADVDVARGELAQDPGIAQVREIIHRIVEIKIIVVHPIHEVPHVVYAGHREAALDHVGMLEQRVGRVIRAERCAHGGDSDPWALAIVPDERHDLFAKVGIENGLYITSMKWMRAFVIKAEAVDGIDAEEFDFAAFDEIGQRADHALTFQFRFVARASRETENRLPPMAVDKHAHVNTEPGRIPAVIFTFHKVFLARGAGKKSMPAQPGWGQWN